MLGYLRIGLLVQFIHDVSDVPLDIVKLFNYLKLQGPTGLFLSEASFLFNIGTWIWLRLYLYPTKCIYSAFFQVSE
jgi:hypothetical protein